MRSPLFPPAQPLFPCPSTRPSFVKIGQALSARPDLLPREYLEILSGLQDRLPSFPNEIALAGGL
jgi:predicted unusual protein kinase regulating ubiquinone biosynthesis (AarF/ABC1/UbiB family)